MATPISNDKIKPIILITALLIYAISFASMMSIVKTYAKNSKTLEGFLVIYIDIIFLFAAIYFFIAVITPKEEAIYGVKAVCMRSTCYKGTITQINDIIDSFLDCIYLSILTMTTSGDTNIGVKNFWGRAIISAQLLTTAFISIVGLANFFSQESSKELAELKKLISEKRNSEKSPPQKPSLMNKIMQALRKFYPSL